MTDRDPRHERKQERTLVDHLVGAAKQRCGTQCDDFARPLAIEQLRTLAAQTLRQ
jgi:hypothetical protein